MAVQPDVVIVGARPQMDGISVTTPVQFLVGMEQKSAEGTAGIFHFWLEFDSPVLKRPLRITKPEMTEYGPLAFGAYNVAVPPDPVPLPLVVFKAVGGYLCLRGHYMPAPGKHINILRMCYMVNVDPSGETFSLDAARGFPISMNPIDALPHDIKDEDDESYDEDVDLDNLEVDEEEGHASEDVGEAESVRSVELEEDDEEEEDEEEEEEEEEEGGESSEQEQAGIKRVHDDDDTQSSPPGKRPRFECANCLRDALLRCSRCKTTFYCNKDCQAGHYGVHSLVCF